MNVELNHRLEIKVGYNTSMLRQFFFLLLSLGLLCAVASAQDSRRIIVKDDKPTTAQEDDANNPAQQDVNQDMLHELEIKRDESSHKQTIERAKESAQLGAELRDTYAQQKLLGQDALKKLGRLEKLARQIRSAAGGTDDAEELKNPPKDLTATLVRMADLTQELSKCVEKTPRQVVSAGVITQTNELLELIKLTRNLAH